MTSMPNRRFPLRHALSSLLAVAVLLPAGAAAQATAAAPVPAAPAPVEEYRLGPGDTVRVLVYQSPDLTLETRISDGGVVSYPLLGPVRLAGLTVGEAERTLAEGLRRGDFVRNPQVTVVLVQGRASQVSVLGLVSRPGRYALEQGGMRLSDLLALAGGPVPQLAGDTVVVLGSRQGVPFRRVIELPRLFGNIGREDDLVLAGNDAVYVERAPQYFIYGEVQRPGQMRLERGMTLLQGLAAGGGLTQRGTEKGIRIHRRGDDGQVQVLQPAMTETLRDGDVIHVREALF